MKKMLLRLSGVLASLALLATTLSVNSTCTIIMYQPKVPDAAKQLRKF